MKKVFLAFIFIHSFFILPSIAQTSDLEQSIETLLQKMTLEEKIGQTAQRGTSSRIKELPEELKEAVRQGRVGSLLNVMNKDYVRELQKIAVEQSPHHIPLIFARDVIHGFKTIFPIPLGQAATWNPEIVEQGASIAAKEASTFGIRWTFAPMLDISRDARWGRIAESAGEDTYLTSVMAKAYIQGFQGKDLRNPHNIAACAKHFVGYGAAEGGRDYNTVILSEPLLRDVYLPPFKAAVDAGVATFMTSFNDVNGVPSSGNKFLLHDILRKEWKFDGFVVSDWNSITEMITHGFCEDEKQAAYKASIAGLDMEMTSKSYENHLKQLIQEGKVSEAQLNDFVRNILRIKFRLGLFEKPYIPESQENIILSKPHLEAAKQAAIQSCVLLKNKNNLLPLHPNIKKIALIGPLADAPREQLGTWTFDGEAKDAFTPLMALKEILKPTQFEFAKGLEYSRQKSEDGFAEAIAKAKNADVILFMAGEEAILSGEAHSRADISLPGSQEKLIEELHKTGKPIILVIMAGRPITLGNIIDKVDAVYMAWHQGTMAGPALMDLIFGKACPSGKLPVTWVKSVGQIPFYYNHTQTGRPADEKTFVPIDSIPVGAWQSSLGNNSHYLDDGYAPLFPFGYGLSYTQFEYSHIQLSKNQMNKTGSIEISADIQNTGSREGTEVVQLYVRDLVGSLVRPVKELKGFERITLKAGEKKTVKFILQATDLAFYNQQAQKVVEAGKFYVWVGKNAMDETLQGSFAVED
jgi:beta-glucosidase